MKVKLQDLAKLCGVDASTVSRAIKNDPRISKATTERVQAVAAKMGYRPNLAARLLKQGHSHIFWFVVPALGTTIDWKIAERASIVAAKKGYDTAIAVHHGRQVDFDRLIDNMGSGLAAGAIVNRRDIKDVSAVRRLLDMNFPLVFIDEPVDFPGADVVMTDNVKACFDLVECCLEEDISEFVLLFDRDKSSVELQRFDGAARAVTKAGLRYIDALQGDGWSSLLNGKKRIGILSSSQQPIQDFVFSHAEHFRDKSLIAGCFDAWQGEPAPAEKAVVAVQDYNGMADAALEHLFAMQNNETPPASEALPIAEYLMLNGRF